MNMIGLGIQLMHRILLGNMVLVERLLKLVLKYIKLHRKKIIKTFMNYN